MENLGNSKSQSSPTPPPTTDNTGDQEKVLDKLRRPDTRDAGQRLNDKVEVLDENVRRMREQRLRLARDQRRSDPDK